MHNISRKGASPPWYRQGWPWFLIAIPSTAVIAGAVTLWLAISSWDGLVVDDYYQQGKTIERTIARSVRAKEMGLSGELRLTADAVRLALRVGDGTQLPPTVILTIAHPTRAGHDRKLLLVAGGGQYAAPIEPLSAGRWLLQLEDESQTWRLNGTAQIPSDTEIRLLPNES